MFPWGLLGSASSYLSVSGAPPPYHTRTAASQSWTWKLLAFYLTQATFTWYQIYRSRRCRWTDLVRRQMQHPYRHRGFHWGNQGSLPLYHNVRHYGSTLPRPHLPLSAGFSIRMLSLTLWYWGRVQAPVSCSLGSSSSNVKTPNHCSVRRPRGSS